MDIPEIRREVLTPVREIDDTLSTIFDYAEGEGLDDVSLSLIDDAQTALHNLIVHLRKLGA